MNTLLTRSTLLTGLASFAAVIALAVALDTNSRAGEPLKGAERLNGAPILRSSVPSKAGSACPATASSCGSCETTRSTRPAAALKAGERLAGTGKPALLAAAHGCNDCVTSLDTIGHGKARSNPIRHSCSMPGTPSGGCCASGKM